MPILPRFLRPALSAALLAFALSAAPRPASAQTVLDVSYPIGLAHDQAYPYNFTGRVFSLADTDTGFGSGTLLRRHTVLTAGHVVFNVTDGFIANATFTRALYEDYSLSQSQIISVGALSGYQSAVVNEGGENTLAAFGSDMGYTLLHDAPVDNTWGSYVTKTALLSDTTSQFFVLGYPGVTFDGRTMAYIVPSAAYVQIGTSIDSGLFENTRYQAEQGESGGPVYVYADGQRYVVGETVAIFPDPTGEFNASIIHGITLQGGRLLEQAEYTGGLIKKVRIKGPRTVTHGTSVIYTALPQFVVPNVGTTTTAVTNRYTEIKLVTSTPGTSTQPAVTITKIDNTQFRVTFASTIRPKSTTTLQAYYSRTNTVQNSLITITVD